MNMLQRLLAFLTGNGGIFQAAGVVARNASANPRGMDVFGHYAVCPFQYTGPNPYATGGEAVTAQQFKLGVLEFIDDFLGVPAAATTGVIFHWNPTTGKMQAFQSTTGAPMALAEVANGTDLSTFIGNGMAFGKG